MVKTFDPLEVILVYVDVLGTEYRQSAADIVEVGTLIDPDTGDDMELVRVEVPNN